MSKKFWETNRELIHEDVTADRERLRAEPVHSAKRLTGARAIAIGEIEADKQHREHFDQESLERLAKSLTTDGQLQPVRVRFDQERGKYIIIAGERRWRAAKLAGLATVECIVVTDELNESDILRHQIVENALREDLRPTEQAKAFADLMAKECWNGKELAERLNVHASTVSRTLALLKLPAEVQEKVDRGELPLTAAIKTGSEAADTAKPKKQRPTRERKLTTSAGITVVLKARKYLKDEDVLRALHEAIEELQKAA